MTSHRRHSFAVGLVLCLATTAWAQTGSPASKPGDAANEQNSLLFKLCRDDTHDYTVTFADDRSSRLEPKEVMKWSNPVRNRQLGVVFLWLKDGRAEAMSTVFTGRAGDDAVNVFHEFQSLSPRRLVATSKAGKVQWSPAQPGITLKPISGAPEPAESPAARLRQMRTLAREFAAHSISTYGEPTRWELRTLAQPLYRYESRSDDLLDGAVFAFMSDAGTDPELILPIEARKIGDRWVWLTDGARFSDHSLYLRHQDKPFWSFINKGGTAGYAADVRDTYRLFTDRTQIVSAIRDEPTTKPKPTPPK